MSSLPLDLELADLVSKLEILKHGPPKEEATRRSLLDAARNLIFALEAPGDTIQRIVYTPLQTTAARIACDISLFEILAEKGDSSSSTTELAEATRADEIFVGRLLRYLASFGMINETGEDLWSASNITKSLSIPGLESGIHHNYDVIMPCWKVLPGFLAETKYQNPTDINHTPFNEAHGTDLGPFLWAQDKPVYLKNFAAWMTACREGQNIFLDVFPFEKEIALNSKPETPLFVDVGGSIGHQCVALKKKLPTVPGRVILQDLPPVIAHAISAEGIEPMVHDFMTEQPIKGARAYYLRNIMHDYPDDRCIVILHQIMKAMDKDSVILIDDMIIPNRGAHWHATQLDLTMMASLGAMERTEKQWNSLMSAAGLKIKSICTYTMELRDSIIVAIPK